MAWRALETRTAALRQSGADRVLGERLALVMALVGLLAILTAGVVAWQMRRRERRHSLHLGGPGVSGPGPGTSSQRWSFSWSRSADLRNLPVALRGMAST